MWTPHFKVRRLTTALKRQRIVDMGLLAIFSRTTFCLLFHKLELSLKKFVEVSLFNSVVFHFPSQILAFFIMIVFVPVKTYQISRYLHCIRIGSSRLNNGKSSLMVLISGLDFWGEDKFEISSIKVRNTRRLIFIRQENLDPFQNSAYHKHTPHYCKKRSKQLTLVKKSWESNHSFSTFCSGKKSLTSDKRSSRHRRSFVVRVFRHVLDCVPNRIRLYFRMPTFPVFSTWKNDFHLIMKTMHIQRVFLVHRSNFLRGSIYHEDSLQ